VPKPLILVPDVRVPAYEPLKGWRRVVNKILRIKFQRDRVVVQTADGVYVCHPDTVAVVTNFWSQQGYAYEIDRQAVIKRVEL
jgi:hypothetical protein